MKQAFESVLEIIAFFGILFFCFQVIKWFTPIGWIGMWIHHMVTH